MDTYFPTTMLLLLEGFRQYFPAQHFAYFRGYVWALAMLGTTRTCMTNVARTCVFVERHLASWERFLAESQWDLRGVSQTLVTQLLQQLGGRLYRREALLAAVDTTLIPKVRGRMPGVQKWHDHSGDPARGESLVGHHWALVGLVSTGGGGYLCWPVLARLLPGQLNPLGFVAGPDGIQRWDFWLVVVALVRELRHYVGAQPLRVVADAYFSKASFLNPLVAEGLGVISRLRKDAVGWDDPAPVVGQRPRGRPRQKGQVWKLATLLQVEPGTELTVLIYGQEERVQVVWRDVWWRDVTHKVRVVVVVTKREPILLVSTDLSLPTMRSEQRMKSQPSRWSGRARGWKCPLRRAMPLSAHISLRPSTTRLPSGRTVALTATPGDTCDDSFPDPNRTTLRCHASGERRGGQRGRNARGSRPPSQERPGAALSPGHEGDP
jgi:DDE superfamily endonuclease